MNNEIKTDLLRRSEQLWNDLQQDNLGGYSGVNRPFYILTKFIEIYQEAENDMAILLEND